MSCILLFHINIFKESSIRSLARNLGIEVRGVPDAECYKTIGVIAGLQEAAMNRDGKKAKPVPFTEEMMVFCGMKPDLLDRFLAEYHSREIPPVGLKAVLTPYNALWTPGRLCAELRKEQQSVEHRLQKKQMVQIGIGSKN